MRFLRQGLLALTMLGALAFALIPTTSAASSGPNGVSPSAILHHEEAVHAAHVLHAEKVHQAHVIHARAIRRYQDYLIGVAERVSICEEGGDWGYKGGNESADFNGGIGFRVATWDMFRTANDPANMGDATPLQQAQALFRFVAYYGIAMPDQNGCGRGY
jgi:hypothetical protein